MREPVDERLVDVVNEIGPTNRSGRFFRFTSARRDPLSGEGARLNGGRWNPPDLFPVIYLAQPVAACMRELEKQAADNHMDVAMQLQVPYRLHTIAVTDVPVLDLTNPETYARLGLEREDVQDSQSWDACQPIGHAAWFLEFGGVLAPSATGDGATLAVFEHRIGPEQIAVEASTLLTHEQFLHLRQVRIQ